jgi:carboxymethylenebutenolidase
MIASLDGPKVMRDTAAVLAHLTASSEVRPGGIAAVGYCMGGGYALLAAGTFPDRIAVAASFHGGSLATDRSDSPHLVAGAMRATVYVGAGELDPTFPPEQRARLEAALDDARVPYRVEVYPGAKHGFAVTGHLAYDHESSERHWRTLFELLERHFGRRV